MVGPSGTEPSDDEVVSTLATYVLEQYNKGRTAARIVEDLLALGVGRDQAVPFVAEIINARKSARRESGCNSLGCCGWGSGHIGNLLYRRTRGHLYRHHRVVRRRRHIRRNRPVQDYRQLDSQ